MYAVTCATGQLGRLVVAALIRRGVAPGEIVALTRDPAKADDLAAEGVVVRQADFKKPETLGPALKGADRLLLISSGDFDDRVAQHRNVIDAAKAAGVGYVAYTSILKAQTSPLWLAADHKGTEEVLAASGIDHAFLRHGWYNENFISAIENGPKFGAVIGASGEGRFSSATRADFAEGDAAALIALKTGPIEMGGDTSFSKAELAAEIAKVTGKSVVYNDMSEADYAAALTGAGLPEMYAKLLAQSDAASANGALEEKSKALSSLSGLATTPISATVASVLG